jgi:hypothetical protein
MTATKPAGAADAVESTDALDDDAAAVTRFLS